MSNTTIETRAPETEGIHPELLELGKPKTHRAARNIGVITVVIGLLMAAIGAFTWTKVSDELAAQNIVVASDAAHFAGEAVTGPFTAYAQAQIIGVHAMHSTDGQTYAEMDKEDPARATAMNASFLQASLYTSVIAFGVAALVMGLGAIFLLTGSAIIMLAKRKN